MSRVVPETVKQAVLAWGTAASLEAAVAILAKHRAALEPAELGVLVREIAEVSVDALTRVLAKSGPDVALDKLNPAQRERLSAWVHDLQPTARALGLTPEAWNAQLQQAMR